MEKEMAVGTSSLFCLVVCLMTITAKTITSRFSTLYEDFMFRFGFPEILGHFG
jgi:hypothetical protein